MLRAVSAIDRLLQIITYRAECELAEFLHLYPELTWKQVLAGVNHLSRSRRLRLKAKGASIYLTRGDRLSV